MSDIKNTPDSWGIGEYWSSSRPHKKVLVLSQGDSEILLDGAHRSFIRWICKSEQVSRLENQRNELLNALELVVQWRDMLAATANLSAKSAILEDFDEAIAIAAKATGKEQP